MKVRIATDRDIPAIFDVRTSVRENHMSREELAALGITPASVAEMLRSTMRAWVGEVDGEVVAFSMADAAQATVFAMFVRPGFDGGGLGRRLMGEAEAWLFASGCPEIWLLTDRDPEVRANGFYQHLGWTSTGIQADGQIRYVKRPS